MSSFIFSSGLFFACSDTPAATHTQHVAQYFKGSRELVTRALKLNLMCKMHFRIFYFFFLEVSQIRIDWLPCSTSQVGSNCGPREPGPMGTLLSSGCVWGKGISEGFQRKKGGGICCALEIIAGCSSQRTQAALIWEGKALDGSCLEGLFCGIPTLKCPFALIMKPFVCVICGLLGEVFGCHVI